MAETDAYVDGADGQIAVDDFVVRQSLMVPPVSTGFYNPLNRHEFENGQKTARFEIAEICLLSRGSRVRVSAGAPIWRRTRRPLPRAVRGPKIEAYVEQMLREALAIS
jgi:hypothetical protein